mmetsp:Transcript_13374/g.56986  ORF Transcript_13374/g.56986 Transcript_13374/m.56986 type:complete len:228 (+) Transcript_13374:465-1148(+)
MCRGGMFGSAACVRTEHVGVRDVGREGFRRKRRGTTPERLLLVVRVVVVLGIRPRALSMRLRFILGGRRRRGRADVPRPGHNHVVHGARVHRVRRLGRRLGVAQPKRDPGSLRLPQSRRVGAVRLRRRRRRRASTSRARGSSRRRRRRSHRRHRTRTMNRPRRSTFLSPRPARRSTCPRRSRRRARRRISSSSSPPARATPRCSRRRSRRSPRTSARRSRRSSRMRA